jgi:hypothetical protein
MAQMFCLALIAACLVSVNALMEPVDLGSAEYFVIFSKACISTVPRSNILGNIGVSSISHGAITGFSETLDSGNTL